MEIVRRALRVFGVVMFEFTDGRSSLLAAPSEWGDGSYRWRGWFDDTVVFYETPYPD
jgi:hypothetical protein